MRLIFKTLEAQNAGAYAELKLNFDTGFTRLTGHNADAGGSNGAGKSTVVKLFFYALFGETPNGQKAKELASDTCHGELQVKLDFTVDGVPYSITRGTKVLSLDDPQYPDLKNKPDVQPRINEILGITQDALLLLTLFNSESVKFAGATPSVRRDLFTAIFSDLRRYQTEFAGRLRDAMQEQQRQLGLYGAELNRITGQGQVLQTEVERIVQQLSSVTGPDEATQQELAALRAKQARSAENVARLQAELTHTFGFPTADEARVYIGQTAEFRNSFLTAVKQLEELEWENKNMQAAHARSEVSWKAALDKLSKLQASIEAKVCPTCGQSLPDDTAALQVAVANAQAEVDRYAKEGEKDLVGLTAIAEQTTAIVTWITANDLTYQNINKLITLIGNLTTEEQTLSQVGMAVFTMQAAPQEAETVRRQLTERLKTIETDLSAVKAEYEAQLGFYTSMQHDIEGLQHLVKISQNDIPNALISEYLARLQFESSEILSQIFPGMGIEIVDSRTTAKGGVKYETNIVVTSQTGKKKRYETFSDGEKQAINIALLFGLQRLIIQDTDTYVNVLFLDEAVDLSVDAVRLEEIVTFLSGEAPAYDTMLLISHKLDLDADFDTKLVAVKEGGVSRLVKAM